MSASRSREWLLATALVLAAAPVGAAGSPIVSPVAESSRSSTEFVAGTAQAPELDFDVLHYAVRLEPDIDAASVSGTVKVTLRVVSSGLEEIILNRGRLTIGAVRREGRSLPFEERGGLLAIRLPTPAAAGDEHEIEVDYSGRPPYGMEFVADRRQVYTIFSTSQWMVCVDSPADRATLEMGLILPDGLVVVANGQPVGRRTLEGGRVLHEWRQDRPVPTFVFGFAAGRFAEVAVAAGDVDLRYLGDGFSKEELTAIFADTPATLAFFERRSGVRYEGLYAQALVAETNGQEMAGLSVMSVDYGRRMLEDESASSLAAHELAHQWWGNMVTNRDWTHFWLNEGFATFMAAAWAEQRFGRQAYLDAMERSRLRYERVRDAGGDRSLVFPDWNSPTADDRTLVYQKGAYVLYRLRLVMGELSFWDGIRHYTRTYFGRSVTTEQFQAAMEESSGRDLSAFFDEWVYLK